MLRISCKSLDDTLIFFENKYPGRINSVKFITIRLKYM